MGQKSELVERLDKASTAYGIEISAEKSKLTTTIPVASTQRSYLGSVITGEGSKPEILSGIAQTTAALTRLRPVWNDRSISQFQDTTDALLCHIHLPVCL